MESASAPAASTQMLIRRPIGEVFEAFIEPAITCQFWFSSGSDRLQAGRTVRWEWEMFGVSEEIAVKAVEPNRRIVIEWPGHGTTNTVEWLFTSRADGMTLVAVTESGFAADDDELVRKVADSTGGFNLVLAGLKAYLEHGVRLNLVADRFPDGPPGGA
jgi:uncharacterized protein YndB with AHSA1/START domain